MTMTSENEQPWITIRSYIDEGDANRVKDFLENFSPAETARIVSRLDEDHRTKLLVLLEPEDAAELLQDLPDEQAADLVEEIPHEEAAAIVSEMPEDAQADLLEDINKEHVHAILAGMSQPEAARARQFLAYGNDTAGGLMTTEFLSFRDDWTVGQVLDDLQAHGEEYADYYVQYAYVISVQGQLRGVLPMRNLLMSVRTKPVKDLMLPDPSHVKVDAALDVLEQIFEEHPYYGIPVVDDDGILLGVISREEVLEALKSRDKDSYLKASGIVGGEELRSMPVAERASRRLSWLIINIFLNLIAASVIALYEETLSQAIILAVFLPIISDMSGSSGNQALAVSIRELSLGLVRPYEVGRVFMKELGVGIINGLILGVLVALVALIWKGNGYLGLVVGGALALNTVIGVTVGGSLPLILKFFKKDPALASGLILTTITDMCGFFFILSFAQHFLQYLV